MTERRFHERRTEERQRRIDISVFFVMIILMGLGIHKWSTSATKDIVINQRKIEATTQLIIHQNHDKCVLINIANDQGNVRGQVIKEFIQAAETARAESAAHETGTQRLIDLNAASSYHKLAQRLHDVKVQACGDL